MPGVEPAPPRARTRPRSETARTRQRLPDGRAFRRSPTDRAPALSGPAAARPPATMPRSVRPARSPRSRGVRADRAEPPAPAGGRTPVHVSREADEPIARRLRDVAHLPACTSDLVAQPVGFGEVVAVPSLAAPLGKLDDVRGCLLDLGQRAEPEQREPRAERGPLLAVTPGVEERERVGRVEVLVEDGGKFLLEEHLSRSVPRTFVEEEVAERVRLRLRLDEHLVAELDRLPPVRAEEEEQDDLATPGVEDVAQRDVVAERLRHLLAVHAAD